MARFFVSDTHFSDDRFNLLFRPFKTVQEQEDYLVDKWNSVVGPNDEIYHIGDFATTDEGLEVVKRLNGTIHLILGNYDDLRPIEKLRELFASVNENQTLTLSNGMQVILNHYPNRASKTTLNLVGHIHSLWKVQRNMINVSCDAWHYTPLSEEQIIFLINSIDKFYDDNVFAGELDCNLALMDGMDVYATEPIPKIGKKVFLAGPTPRSINVKSWRPSAVKILRESGYRGHIIIPEKRNYEDGYDYDTQIEWEDEGLEAADIIVFWVPRDLETMPGFTTNIEFGCYMKSGKCVFGYPEEASKMRYMAKKAVKYGISVFDNLEETCKCAIKKISLDDE